MKPISINISGLKFIQIFYEEFRTEDMSIGLAYRNARNQYLPQDAEWLV